MSGGSTSNLVAHYKRVHTSLYDRVEAAGSTEEKIEELKTASASTHRSTDMLRRFATQLESPTPWTGKEASKSEVCFVNGVLMAASLQLPLSVLGTPELQSFVHAAGGAVSTSKTPYLRRIYDVYEVVAERMAAATDVSSVGSFTYDGWSAARGEPIAGMTFNYVTADWKMDMLPICFFNTEDIGKSGDDHAAILRAAVSRNDKLGDNVLMFTGTCDNEPAVCLGVDQFLGFSGGVRCIAHTLALAVNESVPDGSYTRGILNRINSITTYLNMHTGQLAKFFSLQADVYGADRVSTLDNEFPTRWHSKLNVIEKYINLKDYIIQVLPAQGGPALLSDTDEEAACELVQLMHEIRRVSRALEADKRVSASRAPRLLAELVDTLDLLSRSPHDRAAFAATLPPLRQSDAGDDKALRDARDLRIRDEEARKFARLLKTNIKQRLGFLLVPVGRAEALLDPSDVSDDEKKRHRVKKQAILFHCAALFDVNECGLEWLRCSPRDRADYVDLLTEVIANEARAVLMDTFSSVSVHKDQMGKLHKIMIDELDAVGRRKAEEALLWWQRLEGTDLQVLMRRKLLSALYLLPMARAYLSIQATSASAERLFGDAGYQQGNRRQHQMADMSEMLFAIRGCVKKAIDEAPPKGIATSLSQRASAVQQLARDIANVIQAKKERNTNTNEV